MLSNTDLFVILLKGSQILSGLGELSLFHTLSDVPVDEGTLGVHQIEFVVKTGPGLGNGGGVAQHVHGTLHLGEVTAGNDSGWLVVDSTLKPVGHQSTNWMVLLVLMVAMAALTSLGTTSPRYNIQQAMYLPCLGSHLTIWLAGSKQALVISATESCSWYAFSADITGA